MFVFFYKAETRCAGACMGRNCSTDLEMGQKFHAGGRTLCQFEESIHIIPDSVCTKSSNILGRIFTCFLEMFFCYIRNLRKKIDEGRETKLIHTVRYAGYVLREEA